MSGPLIEVIDGGFFTTVQDLGRFGYQRYGVPVSGAMDLFAVRAANLLTGTVEGAAALEITLQGPRLRFLVDTVIAVTGAEMEPSLDDAPIRMWHPSAVSAGAVLSFGRLRQGLRAYLAVAGGFDVPVVLGSRSTFTRTGLGGCGGRTIDRDDVLAAFTPSERPVHGRTLPPGDIPQYVAPHAVRVIPGPQDDAFTAAGMATFLSTEYVISPDSDRIGCRLDGPRIEHQAGADIVSDGTPFGAIQVAGDGRPIILMADRGTTGGYAKVATVISADLFRIAQARPGDRVHFRSVSMAEAIVALREQEGALERLARATEIVFARRRYEIDVEATPYAVTVGFAPQQRPVAASGDAEYAAEIADWSGVRRVRVRVRDYGAAISAAEAPRDDAG